MTSIPVHRLQLAAVAVLVAALASAPAFGLDKALLFEKISRLEADLGNGKLGVGVQDLATGRTWFHRGQERFPMESVCKVPIAIAVLRDVDSERIGLHEPVRIRRNDLSVPHSAIAEGFKGQSEDFRLRALVEQSVGGNDNTASDILLRIAGGPRRVSALMRVLDLDGVRVDRSARTRLPESIGLGRFRKEWVDGDALMRAVNQLSAARRRAALRANMADPRDTATPRSMIALLAGLHHGKLLSDSSTRFLLDIMTGTTIGPNRLKAGLPEGAQLAHKAGSSLPILGVSAATNDVGIVTLPDGRSLAIAVFLGGVKAEAAKREGILAEVARVAVEAMP